MLLIPENIQYFTNYPGYALVFHITLKCSTNDHETVL